jgi:predicted secreted Zn-dependent protease
VVSHVAKMADGLTSWEVQYDFSLVEGGGVCRLRGPHVTLAVQQSYPVAAAQDPYRAAVLDSYLRPLVEHEQGHLRIDRAAAHMLAEALRAVSPQPACDAVREEAWRVAALALENCKASNAAFDAATAHGLR